MLDVINESEVLTVRVYKVFQQVAWANTYEVQALQEITNTATALEDLANKLVNLERPLHAGFVTFDRVVVSTWVPDGQPYNPLSFTSFPLQGQGTRNVPTPLEPLTQCLYVRRNTILGRDGRLLYRGCLSAQWMSSGVPEQVISSSELSNIQSIINNWTTSNPLLPSFRLVLARRVGNSIEVRPVVSLVAMPKVVTKKFNNRYYDRVRQQP